MGKTELAVEYAHRFRDKYDIVWWVDAAQPARLTLQLARLADQLGLPARGTAARCSTVLSELPRRDRWLLIYDNVPDPQSLEGFLPETGRGHVIVTSRFRSWGAHATPVRVDEFTEDEAVAYLVKRLPGTSRADAAALAHELGQLPLALAQAGAYAAQRGIGADRYLALYRRHRTQMLAVDSAERYPLAVQATFELALAEIATRSAAARQLLLLCAFLAPDSIPAELLAHGAAVLPQPLASTASTELGLVETIGLLHAYSLLEHTDGIVRVHRLVQDSARSALAPSERSQWLSYAVRLLDQAMQRDESLRPVLITHALKIAEHQLATGD